MDAPPTASPGHLSVIEREHMEDRSQAPVHIDPQKDFAKLLGNFLSTIRMLTEYQWLLLT